MTCAHWSRNRVFYDNTSLEQRRFAKNPVSLVAVRKPCLHYKLYEETFYFFVSEVGKIIAIVPLSPRKKKRDSCGWLRLRTYNFQ